MVASWYFTRDDTFVRPAGSAVMPRVNAWGGAKGQYLGRHRFCLISWRLIDGWILYLICWFSVTQTLTWIYVCRSVTYISWSSDFALYIEDCLMDKCHNLDICSMWCRFISLNVCGSVTYISWSIDFVISWRLFDGWMLHWRYWFSVTQTLTLNCICRSVTYISWSSDFALYLEDYLMDKCYNWNIGSVWCTWVSDLLFMVQWFCHILKTCWWRNIVWYGPLTCISWFSDFESLPISA